MGLRSKWEKFCSFGYVLTYVATHRRSACESGRILIYMEGHMGDVLIDASAIEALIQFYLQQGKQVYFAGTKLILSSLKLVMSLDQVTLFTVKDKDDSYGNVREIMKFLGNIPFERVITFTPCEKLYNISLIACVNSSESWQILHRQKRFRVNAWKAFLSFFHRGYTHSILTDLAVPEAERGKILLQDLGIKDFQTRIPYIPKQCDYTVPEPYITIAVDSMHPQRRWPIENNIKLINSFLEQWGADIYITGSRLEQRELDQYKEAFQGNERVKITIGRLKLGEWIELIRGSIFHIGVDSGSIHVAASVGTVSFCLTGAWDSTRVFPYQRDLILPGTVAPICVYRSDVDVHKLPCRGCFGVKVYGYGNQACLNVCKQLQPCLCLERITVDDVLSAIYQAQKAGVIHSCSQK